MKKDRVSRRDFLKTTGAGSVAIASVTPAVSQSAKASVNRHAMFAALGDTLIPSDPDDPGYQILEPYNITAEVMKGLTALKDEDLALFNSSAAPFFAGKTFLQLVESQRADYLRLIIDGNRISDKLVLAKLRSIYRISRLRVMTVYYQNYPEHRIPRDSNDVPILPAGDTHQITNPDSTRLMTGWDRAGYHGPLTWEEEERRRAWIKKLDWKE
jgi:hypothetical protein